MGRSFVAELTFIPAWIKSVGILSKQVDEICVVFHLSFYRFG